MSAIAVTIDNVLAVTTSNLLFVGSTPLRTSAVESALSHLTSAYPSSLTSDRWAPTRVEGDNSMSDE